MKILHIQAQLPTRTGSGVYFSNVIKGLANNHEQACIYGCYEGYSYHLLQEKNQFPVVFPNESCMFPLPGMSDVMPYESTIYGEMTEEMLADWSQTFREAVQQAYTAFQPDVILCHHLWILASMVREMYPQDKVFAFCHGTDIRQAEQHPRLHQKYVQHIHNMDGVFSLSELQVDEIVTVYGIEKEKVTVVGGGFDASIFYPPKEKKKNKDIQLIFAGKIAQAKGVFQLVEAFEKVCEVKENVVLSIIGAANEEARAFIAPFLKKNNKLKLYNVANQQLLADGFRKGDIFVLPSYYEGLGLVAIESLACSMHVVVTEIPALQAQLGETINQSGVITYVPLPRLHNEDEPYEEDIGLFRQQLTDALLTQINKIERGEQVHANIHQEIMKSSWKELIGVIDRTISKK